MATVLAATYAPADALTRQLRAEQAPRLRRLVTRVPDAELLALALREPSWHLQELAGERAGQKPALLAALDVRQPAWRVIWAAALRRSRSLTAGIAQPAETITALLAEVAGGRVRELELSQLLEPVAASPFANVLALPARPHLWEQLPAALQAGFLQATLDALVAAVLAGTWTSTVEPALLRAGSGNLPRACCTSTGAMRPPCWPWTPCWLTCATSICGTTSPTYRHQLAAWPPAWGNW